MLNIHSSLEKFIPTVPPHLETDILPLPTPLPLLPGVTLEQAFQNRRSTRAFAPITYRGRHLVQTGRRLAQRLLAEP